MAIADVQCQKCGGQNPGDYSFCTVCGASVKNKKKNASKAKAIGLFVLAMLFWAGDISHDTLGFVPPVNGEAIGFDVAGGLFWLWPLYAGRTLYRAFFVDNKVS
jgi:hypothetical protein